MSYTLVLEVTQPAPLEEWSYRFGEAVHNLRAALDNYLVDVVKRAGIADPKQWKRIQFPICATEKEWRESAKRIAVLPGALQSAIEQVQPFKRPQHGEELKTDVLLLLRELSNQDKHHARVTSILEPASQSYSGAVEFETEEGATASVPPDTTVSRTFFQSGDVLLVHRTKGRIARVSGRYGLHLQVVITTPDGRLMGITDTLAALCQYTDVVLRHVSAAQQ